MDEHYFAEVLIKNAFFVESFTGRLAMQSNVILLAKRFEHASELCSRTFYFLCSAFFHCQNENCTASSDPCYVDIMSVEIPLALPS